MYTPGESLQHVTSIPAFDIHTRVYAMHMHVYALLLMSEHASASHKQASTTSATTQLFMKQAIC